MHQPLSTLTRLHLLLARKKMSLKGFSHQTGSVRIHLGAKGYYWLDLGHPWAVIVNPIVTSSHLRATTEHLLAPQH